MNNDKRFFGNKTAAERDLAKRRASRLNGTFDSSKIKILDVTVILMTVLSLYALFVMQERLNYQSEQVIHDMTHTNFKR